LHNSHADEVLIIFGRVNLNARVTTHWCHVRDRALHDRLLLYQTSTRNKHVEILRPGDEGVGALYGIGRECVTHHVHKVIDRDPCRSTLVKVIKWVLGQIDAGDGSAQELLSDGVHARVEGQAAILLAEEEHDIQAIPQEGVVSVPLTGHLADSCPEVICHGMVDD
jgi:hypothetical protein